MRYRKTTEKQVAQIKALREQCLSFAEIGKHLGMTQHQVRGISCRAKLPRKPAKPNHRVFPFGSMGFDKNLTVEDFHDLLALAQEWGCETLCEAALEIVKDALAEDRAKRLLATPSRATMQQEERNK